MHVLVPIAGKNRAFENQGLPKPLTLVSGNRKHFEPVRELKLKIFQPGS